jgi:hypothetical protein
MTVEHRAASPGTLSGWRWDVALSFAGAQQDYVEQVATAPKARGVRVRRVRRPGLDRHERRAALARAVPERREYVLPARFDDT